jgi:hypothetical protein
MDEKVEMWLLQDELITVQNNLHSSVVGWGTVVQDGRLRVWFLMKYWILHLTYSF